MGVQLWTTNSAGWDSKGATLSLLCVRYSENGGPEDPNVDPAYNKMVLAVTREVVASNPPGAYQMLGEPNLMGHFGVTGPHTRYSTATSRPQPRTSYWAVDRPHPSLSRRSALQLHLLEPSPLAPCARCLNERWRLHGMTIVVARFLSFKDKG